MFALPARPASGHFLLALRYSASVANQWKVPRRPISTAIRDNSALKKARYALKSLSQEPDSETKLKIYALYKQATKGNADGRRPVVMDFEGLWALDKYDAWRRLEGVSPEQALRDYFLLVDTLLDSKRDEIE